MTDRQALLAAIIARPEEDTPRLAFADWLEERGDAYFADWAALIRVQTEAARAERFSPRWLELVREQVRLFAKRAKDWEEPATGIRLAPVSYRRGFREAARVYAEQFAARAGLLFETNPIRAVWLSALTTQRGRVVDRKIPRSPLLQRVELLDLSENPIDHVREFVRNCGERLRNVRGLGLGHSGLGPLDLFWLLSQPALAGVTALDLHDNPVYPVDFLPVLIGPPAAFRLTWLDLSGCGLGSRASTLRVGGAGLPALRVLRLAEAPVSDHPRIGAAGAAHLAAMKAPQLEHLDLSAQELGDDGVAVLAGSPLFAGLRELRLWANDIGDEGVRAIANSPGARNLRHLDLSENPITDAAAAALVQSPHLDRLGMLELCECPQLSPGAGQALRDRFPVAVSGYHSAARHQAHGLLEPPA